MSFTKSCPHCAKQMTYQEKRAYSTLIGVRKVAPCPRCGTPLRWNANDWRLLIAGALVLLVGFLGLLVTVAQGGDSISAFDGVVLVGSVITLVGVLRLRLEVMPAPPDAN